jgi:hypothetical protein
VALVVEHDMTLINDNASQETHATEVVEKSKKQVGKLPRGWGQSVALVIEHDIALINNNAAKAVGEVMEIQGLGILWGGKDYRLPNQRAHARCPTCCMLSQALSTVE